jgi:hypothetical protein
MNSAESTAETIDPEQKSLCHVIYVRCTRDELNSLKGRANAARISVQRFARITLGLTDRGGYRNRKEQPNGKQARPETGETSLSQRDTESPLPANPSHRIPLSPVSQ